jgi:hypothetical protein
MAKPDLQYSAPELVASVSDAPISGAADVFSLACVAYRVLRQQPLFTAQTTSEYRGTLASMNLLPVDGLPSGLQVRLATPHSITHCTLPCACTALCLRMHRPLPCVRSTAPCRGRRMSTYSAACAHRHSALHSATCMHCPLHCACTVRCHALYSRPCCTSPCVRRTLHGMEARCAAPLPLLAHRHRRSHAAP